MSKRVLIVEDDVALRGRIANHLREEGYGVIEAGGENEALQAIQKNEFDAAVVELRLDSEDSGFVLSHKIKKLDAKKPVIIISDATCETRMGFGIDTRDDRRWIKADALLHKDLRLEQLSSELARFF
jgi:DNA-binding response OmpR family regulator